MVTKKLTKVQQQNIIFRLYALLMSQYCILEGRKAKAILPTDNPMSDFCVMGFAIPAAVLMYQAFGKEGTLREEADKVLAKLVDTQ